MPTSVGPNTYGEENLVFGYDLGDTVNSYKGEPAYNRHNYDKSIMNQTGFDGWGCYDGNNSTPAYHSWGVAQSKTLVTLPGPDGKDTNAMLYHNFTGGFHGPTDWGTGVPAAIVTAGNKITLQAWVKAADAASVGKTVTPYIYVYVNGGGAQATSTNFTLTADWQLVKTTITISADGYNNNGFIYFFTSGGSNIKMYFTKTAVLSGIDHAVQWLPGGTTRSATQGLIDLTGNSTIDLTNVSFDSNAQMTFDGTNDEISISDVGANLQNFGITFEMVWKQGSIHTSSTFGEIISPLQLGIIDLGVGPTLYFQLRSSTVALRWQRAANDSVISPTTSQETGVYNLFTGVLTSTGVSLYKNGELVGTTSHSKTFQTWYNNTVEIGTNAYNTAFDGDIPLTKIYNRALTASEVASNYKAIKGRFNI